MADRGYQILERNYYSRARREIDLIALEKGCLVFIEVKFRSSVKNGDPAEAVGPAKQNKIRAAAGQYLQEHPEYRQAPCRFDVVAILGDEIRLIQDAF